MVMTALVRSCDYETELKAFTKLHMQAFEMLVLFFQKHMEVVFLKFD